MNPYEIRPGSREDFPQVAALWQASVCATHSFLNAADFLELAGEIEKTYLPALDELWLCLAGSELAGFCGNNGAKVEMLFVHPLQMRKGVGAMLLAHARIRHGPLELDVNEANAAALAFYLRRGFRVIGRSELDGQGREYPILHLKQFD